MKKQHLQVRSECFSVVVLVARRDAFDLSGGFSPQIP